MLEVEHPLPGPCLGRHDQLARLAAEKPGLISFAGGLPDPSLFPKRALSEAFLIALEAHGRSALQYGWPEGSLDLREEVARLLAARGTKVEPARVIITSGAQQALLLALFAAPTGASRSSPRAIRVRSMRFARPRPSWWSCRSQLTSTT